MLHINKTILKKVYGRRDDWCRKYDFGSLLVVGGSRIYSGSPAFNAMAAYRSGCDLVTVAAPERAADIVAGFMPDMIACPLKGGFLARRHLPELMKLAARKTAVVIGGGLGREAETMAAVREFLKRLTVPAVIDADAIHAVAKSRILKVNSVVTPHAGEFFALTGKKPSGLDERTKAVMNAAASLRCTILLKGHVDVISDSRNTALNSTGSPYMTKGGCGDVLAGVAGALLARRVGPFLAACAAAYISGKAGELAGELGESMTASDVIGEIHRVIK